MKEDKNEADECNHINLQKKKSKLWRLKSLKEDESKNVENYHRKPIMKKMIITNTTWNEKDEQYHS